MEEQTFLGNWNQSAAQTRFALTRWRRLGPALLIAIAALHSLPAMAAEFYVAPNGLDTNPGTYDLPKKNAQLVMNSLSPGDSLYFKAGTYQFTESLVLNRSGAPEDWITIASAPGETAVLDGGLTDLDDSILEVRGQNYVSIERLRMQNGKQEGLSVWKSKHVVIKENHTFNTWGPGIAVWGDPGSQTPSQYVTVWNNKVEKPNSWDAQYGRPSTNPNDPPHEGITMARVEDFEVAYNEVWGGYKEGIDMKGPDKRGVIHHNYVHDLPRTGIYVDAWTNKIEDIEVHNNVVHDSYSDGLSGMITVDSEDNQLVDDVRIHHNLGYDNKRWMIRVSGSAGTSNVHVYNNTGINADHGLMITGKVDNLVFQNNIMDGIRYQHVIDTSTGSGRDIDYNLFNADPALADTANNNYHLVPGSAAIDAGNPDPFYNDPDGTRNDIGAFHLGQTNTSWDYWLGSGWEEGEPPHPWDLSDPGAPGGVDEGYEPATLLFADDFIMDPLAPGPVGRGGEAPNTTNGWSESGAWSNATQHDAFGVARSVAQGHTGSLTRTISTEGYDRVALQLFVIQDDNASYETLEDLSAMSPTWSDFLEIEVNTGSEWERVLLDHGAWNGADEGAASGWSGEPGNNFNDPTAFIDLPIDADDNASFQVRITTRSSQADELWFLDYFQLRGDAIVDSLPGDYNEDGRVNLADYTVWRDKIGSDASLPNDPFGDQNGGAVGVGQYDQWKQNFGQSQTLLSATAVPAPGSSIICLQMLLFGACASTLGRQSEE